MIEKIKEFKLGVQEYQKLAEKSAEKGDYKRALSHLFSALNFYKDHYEIYGDIAGIYTEINQHERATEYWFKFLSIAPEQEKTTAYEGLALNYFYLDKMLILLFPWLLLNFDIFQKHNQNYRLNQLETP